MGPITVILAAVVTYVAPDGVYLDEGAADGVREGDVVQIGETRLTVVAVSPEQARTEPPPNPFALRIGAEARIQRTGAIRSPTADPGPRKATPPAIDAGVAAGWWPAAGDGWVEPRPLPDGARRPTEPADRVFGVLAIGGRLIDYGGATWRAEARTRLAIDDGRFWYRHDARLNLDRHEGRHPEAPLEVRRLEAGWLEAGWGLRGGRMVLADPLAAASLDGAALDIREVGLDTVRIFAGLAPHPFDLDPESRNPQVGVATTKRVDFGGDGDGLTVRATALVSGFDGALDRAALAPDLTLYAGPVRVLARAELDAHPDRTRQGPVQATRLYGAVRVELTDGLDAQARYDRYAPPDTPSTAALGPVASTPRQTGYADLRLDGGSLGVARISTAVLDGADGPLVVPGLDYWVALSEHLDLSLGAFDRRDGRLHIVHGRASATLRWDAPWPISLDLGARVRDVGHADRAELDHTTLTGEIGLWMATPAGLDLRLTAERSAEARVGDGAVAPATVVFADLRWRFGR